MDTPDQPITIDRPTDLPGAPMSACLGFDHPCLKCDYNLRGLAINASCPECNSAVTDSLKRRLFRHADPRFVRKLRGGARMIAISSILPIPSLILVVMFMMTTAVVGGSGGLLLGAIVPIILIVLIWGLFLFGWIRLTAKEFDTASDGQANKDRARCRLLSILLAFAIPASFILSIGSFSFAMAATGSMAGTVWMLVFSALISVLTAFQFWASARHLGHLSDRIPATGLPKYASALFWVCAVAMAVGIVQSIAGYFMMQSMMAAMAQQTSGTQAAQSAAFSSTSSVAFVLNGMLSLVSGLLSLAIYVMYVGLYCRLWAHLSKACKMNPG